MRRERAGHVGHAAGRAHRRAGEGAGEAGAAGGQLVDVGRVDVGAAVGAGGPGAVVVGHEHDHVGAAPRRAAGPDERRGTGCAEKRPPA